MSTARLVRGLFFVLLTLGLGAAAGAAEAATGPPRSIVEHIAELDRLVSAIEPSDRRPDELGLRADDIPSIWLVRTPQRTFEISTSSLAGDLRLWQQGDTAAHARLLSRLHTLRSEAASFEQPVNDSMVARGRLTDILSTPEFRGIHGPTWVDRLRQRMLQIIAALLGRVLRSSAIPTVTNTLVYGVVALAVLVLAWWIYGLMRREADIGMIPLDRAPEEKKEWPVWLADAQAAAADGRWREGIHFTYWCAVSFLESTGAWRPDRARTPREYLGLVSSASEAGSTLAALTRQFERVWYGTETADADAFAEAIASLKKMGCPSA